MEQPKNRSLKGPEAQWSPMKGWLLLGTLAIGYIFAFVLFPGIWKAESLREFMPVYALFWCAYLVVYHLCLWKRVARRWEAWYLLGAVLVLFLHSALYAEPVLNLLNFLFIPLVLMLHGVQGAFSLPKAETWPLVRAYFLGWFLCPFSALDQWFRTLGRIFQGKSGEQGGGTRRSILLGLLCGLPVFIIVCTLLLQADMAMSLALADVLKALRQISFGKLACMLAIALLFYSFLYNMTWGEATKIRPPAAKGKGLPPQAFLAAAGLLLGAYAVFAVFQFTYLTGLKGLPAGLTYSEYAVSGFSQLLWVTAINLGVFALGLCAVGPHKYRVPVLTCLLAATVVVLISAAVRLGLYIEAYALTWKRILSAWLMAYLAIVVVLCFVRLRPKGFFARRRIGLFHLCVLFLVGWYVLLNIVNVEGMIARSVLRRAEDRGGVLSQADADYLRYTLSQDAAKAIAGSDYVEQVYYDVAPADWPGHDAHTISHLPGLEASTGTVLYASDTHGGFHGDGTAFLSVQFSDGDAVQRIAAHPDWAPLPLPDNLMALAYGLETGAESNGPYLVDEGGSPLFPQVERGWYYFEDRHGEAVSPQDDGAIFERNSFNLTLAVYDAETNILYFCTFDT